MLPLRILTTATLSLMMVGAVRAQDQKTPQARAQSVAPARPNIVMIAIDDLNDWVEPLGGHPQVQTPAMAKLAQRAVTFTNAHCQAPLCNPSRTSVMTGLRPGSTGVYGLSPWFRTLPEFNQSVTMQQYFHRHGYQTLIGGKIFHGAYGRGKGSAAESDVWGPNASVGALPEHKLIPPTPGGNHPLMDWGTFPHRDEDKGDWKVASWAVDELEQMQDEKPFFLSVGFSLPHVPCYATQKWFDLYPEDSLILPPIFAGDRGDTPDASWYIHWNLPEPRTKWLIENDQLKPLVRAYLASISFVDSQVGRVLDALEASPYADNTIVVLWSDHGYHLGEKAISGKNSLWARSTHVPLMFAGPTIAGNRQCDQPAELLDIYPTLASLAGLPQPDGVEGISLTPQLNDVSTTRERPAICTHNAGNHSVCDQRWRYIVYADGSEELYDRSNDPNEFDNLLHIDGRQPELAAVVERLRGWLPKQDRPLAAGSAHRILEKRPDGFYWEGKKIDPESPPLDN